MNNKKNSHGENLDHLWLPYTQMKTAPEPLNVARTQGCKLILEDGRELIDGLSSWWAACHGYNHPHIQKAVEKQLQTMPHVMFAGLVHEPAKQLAERLAKITHLPRCFFSDSGSTSVEVAIKIALQYWRNKDIKNKGKVLCFRNGYHGDTIGAMAISDPGNPYSKPYEGLTHKQYVVDVPTGEYDFDEFNTLMDGIGPGLSAVIIEPLVQGAGGLKFHSPDVLAEIYRITKAHDVLFIADEIMTGLGRTGTLFACQEAGITPDIMCVGKALTGGTMTMAATMASDEVFEAFLDDDLMKALMHGPTFMANPLACAAANASLDLFEQEDRLGQVEAIEQQMLEELEPCRTLDGVVDVRVKGAIGVVQMDKEMFENPEVKHWFRKQFIDSGVWLRPLGDVIYMMPPFVISPDELTRLTSAVIDAIKAKG